MAVGEQASARAWDGALPGVRMLALSCVAGIALALRLRLAWENIDSIVVKSTPDDAYYYFQIARNVAHGHNVTFDGETVTNGFHPLWLALITPVFWFADGDAMPVHIILTMGALLGTATVLLIFGTLMRLTGNAPAALLGAAFFAMHPQTVADSVNGVESALVVCMFMLVVWMFVGIATESHERSLPEDALFGAACGLMILARTDTVFVVPPLLAYMAWRTAPTLRVQRSALFGSACIAVLLPWLLWSLIATGTVIQVSGLASGWFAREVYTGAHGDSFRTYLGHGATLTRTTLGETLMHHYFVPHRWKTLPFVAALGAVLALMWIAPPQELRDERRHQLALIALPALGVVAALCFHTGYRWQVRDWYLAPSAAVGALLIGVIVSAAARAIERAISSLAGDRPRARLAPIAFMAIAGIAMLAVLRPQDPAEWVFYGEVQSNHLATARWIDANTEPDARIGSFNAGVIGYFSHRTVVNLDGVVNRDAFRALRTCDTTGYAREKRLRYIADLPSALRVTFCGGNEGAYTIVATIGRPIDWPDKGLLQVLRVGPVASKRQAPP